MIKNLNDIIYLSKENYDTLINGGSITKDGETFRYSDLAVYAVEYDAPVDTIYISDVASSSLTADGNNVASPKAVADAIAGITPPEYTAGTGIDITNDVISVETSELSYNDLANKPTIPTATSDLDNDSGFINLSQAQSTATTAVNSHNGDTTAHQDIRTAISGKEESGTAATAVSNHNNSSVAHSDIRNAIPTVVDNVTSTSTTNALSAKQGKNLNDRINNVSTRGRFLSLWNCVTGLPKTNPSGYPYEYHTGDFFIVHNTGSTNYIPNGSSYTGVASTTVYSGSIKVNDTIFYDGTTWSVFDTPAESGSVQDVYVNNESVLSSGIAYVEVPTATSDLTNDSGFIDNTYHDTTKQDTLVSGTNIKTINNTSLLGSGDITISGEEQIFIARVNSTSYNDVLAAYNAGKMVFCKRGDPLLQPTQNYLYTLVNYSSLTNQFYFSFCDSSLSYTDINYAILDINNQWSYSHHKYGEENWTFTVDGVDVTKKVLVAT